MLAVRLRSIPLKSTEITASSAPDFIAANAAEEKAALPADEKLFFACVKAGFGQRRKTLRNALSAGLDMPRDRVGKILEEAGVDEGRRAETLSIGEFAAISDVITKQTAEV